MSDWEEHYEIYSKRMNERFPLIFNNDVRPYGGFCIGEGWYPIVESLCADIQSHIDWKNQTRERLLKDNPYMHTVPDEVPQVIAVQIKEKFGGLRFYYEGGDDVIYGMVRMAESWAEHTCEKCGKPGKIRHGGWMQTLCDEHEVERQSRMKQYESDSDD